MNNKDLRAMEKLFGNAVAEKPAKGFYTRREIQKLWNLSEPVVSRKIALALKNNLLEVRMYRVTSGMVTRPIPHYRIKNEQD
jgi:DNA-binding transcriptional regulator LsrR (DeoR family)